MLTSQLALCQYDFARGRVLPDRLTRNRHGHYLRLGERMLRIYRAGEGRTRRELHREVEGVFAREEVCPARRIGAFCKLLDEAGEWDGGRSGEAAKLRREVFRLAAPHHPLVENADALFDSQVVKVQEKIAAKLGQPWAMIERDLFADIIELHRLNKFDGPTDAAALLARYNVAQVQAALYRASAMTVWASEDFKTIVRYAKLARLMHTITRTGAGEYCLRLDGPASVLRQTRRYGVAMARFLPALIACRGWRMHASVAAPRSGRALRLDLSSDDGLKSHLPPPEDFDSTVEEKFAAKWGDEPRGGWRLVREGRILHEGQHVFVPDFALVHDDGREVLLEIIGFWTPEYLTAKAKTLSRFRDRNLLLAVSQMAADTMPELAVDAVTYKTTLSVKQIVERLPEA